MCSAVGISGIHAGEDVNIYRAQGSRYDYVFVVMPTGIRAGYLQDPRLQEMARTRGREQTYMLVC